MLAKNHLPAEDAKHQIEHKEASDHDQGNEKHKVEGVSNGIVGLKKDKIYIPKCRVVNRKIGKRTTENFLNFPLFNLPNEKI